MIMIACQEEDEIEEEVINMLEESNDHQWWQSGEWWKGLHFKGSKKGLKSSEKKIALDSKQHNKEYPKFVCMKHSVPSFFLCTYIASTFYLSLLCWKKTRLGSDLFVVKNRYLLSRLRLRSHKSTQKVSVDLIKAFMR